MDKEIFHYFLAPQNNFPLLLLIFKLSHTVEYYVGIWSSDGKDCQEDKTMSCIIIVVYIYEVTDGMVQNNFPLVSLIFKLSHPVD